MSSASYGIIDILGMTIRQSVYKIWYDKIQNGESKETRLAKPFRSYKQK